MFNVAEHRRVSQNNSADLLFLTNFRMRIWMIRLRYETRPPPPSHFVFVTNFYQDKLHFMQVISKFLYNK